MATGEVRTTYHMNKEPIVEACQRRALVIIIRPRETSVVPFERHRLEGERRFEQWGAVLSLLQPVLNVFARCAASHVVLVQR
jgi:hypothetical protein